MKTLAAAARIILHVILLRPLIRLLFGFHVEGRRHLRHSSRFVLAANHNSHLDILLIYAVVPIRLLSRTRPVAAKDYFEKNRLIFTIVESCLRPIWIDRQDQTAGGSTLQNIEEAIGCGENIIIFPEGTRGRPGEITRFRQGIGKIARLVPEIPIIPIYLSGSERSLPRHSRIPLPVWHQIQIAPPLRWHGGVDTVTRAVEQRIFELAELDDSQRHHRKSPPPHEPLITAVLGIDGSGKSTVSRLLAQALSEMESSIQVSDELVRFEFGENSQLQPLPLETIRRRVNAYAKHARNLKHYKIPKLAELFLRDALMGQIKRWYRPGSIVLDGSPLLNLTAWLVLYKEELFDRELCRQVMVRMSQRGQPLSRTDPLIQKLPELKIIRRLHLPYMTMPQKIIFLNTDPKISMKRIENRGEQKQAHENLAKLTKLQSAYQLVCGILQQDFRIPVRIVDGNRPLEPIMDEVRRFIVENP